jgi:hypothetical protein
VSDEIARKSDYLEIESLHHYGEIENRNQVPDFEAISSRNRSPIAYFGLDDSIKSNTL